MSARKVTEAKEKHKTPTATQNEERLTMVAITHLVAPATLPSPSESLSVLSYNVLLPNSVDAWWTYKMYSPPLSEENRNIAAWSHRRDLLRDRIGTVNADVVCLQEVSPESFQDDFSFMAELGYDGVELFKKGRFRPATFWKTEKCTLAAPAAHKDRTLLTALKLEGQESSWFVLNCHLQAGNEGKRRVRQIQEGTKAIITMANKLKEKEPASNARAIVCGDFNGGSECGAVHFLEHGFVDETFLEDGAPVSSNKKELAMKSPLLDAMSSIERSTPPTMVVAELISQMVQDEENAYGSPTLAVGIVDRLKKIYQKRATLETANGMEMSLVDVERWLIDINGRLKRGDEYREAARQMGWEVSEDLKDLSPNELKKHITLPADGILSQDGFIAVYQRELNGGKFWGIHHDLSILGEPLDDLGLFTARYDRMYCSSTVQPVAILDFESDKPCPNALEPSDHLPVAACFVPAKK
jgi:exonuclease III